MSERMKVVDVLSTRVYSDSQQIIAQVNNVFVQSAFIGHFKKILHVFVLLCNCCVNFCHRVI